MSDEKPLVEQDPSVDLRDPDEVTIRDRKVVTQNYDLAVDSLVDQIKGNTIFLRPLSDRPDFQRKYVWKDDFASKLIESILLNIPIPPCYLSQNEEFELDVIDGQQRLFSVYRFVTNQFALTSLDVLTELNGKRFFEIPSRSQRQIKTHSLRCVLITNESHPEVKFNVFERLNTNTVPLNQQELRNCIFRGSLNNLLKSISHEAKWLEVLGKKAPDNRMRDEELILRFFAFQIGGLDGYKTPQKYWLNETARKGMKFSSAEIQNLQQKWTLALENSLIWNTASTCFRRPGGKIINKALFDLVMYQASKITEVQAMASKDTVQSKIQLLLSDVTFDDLISRAVDHTSRTKTRFSKWDAAFAGVF